MSEASFLDDSVIGYPDNLALFARPIQNVGIRKLRRVAHSALGGNVSNSKVIKFEVQNSGLNYIDLSKTLLKISAKITNGDGSNIPDVERNSAGEGFRFKQTKAKESITTSEEEAESVDSAVTKPTNTSNTDRKTSTQPIICPLQNTMHSLFQRVDVQLQDCVVTDSNENYAHLAYMKALQTSNDHKNSLQLQMYFENEDSEDTESVNWLLSKNVGFQKRAAAFGGSKTVTMVGRIASPIFDVERLIPNNVRLGVTLHLHESTFSLLSPDIQPPPDFKIVVTDAILEVAMVEVTITL